jgi:hypothetical protein
MKTVKSICVYRNMEHEQLTRVQLESARKGLQSLINEWHMLEIGECPDIYELLMKPEQLYKTRIDTPVEVPALQGRFSMKKSAHLSTLDLPDPSLLYASAKALRQQSFTAYVTLWRIEDNQVALVESEAEILIDSQSIYANDPEKIRLAKDLNKLCDLLNSLNWKSQ